MWPGVEAAGNETTEAGQAQARASLADLPISTCSPSCGARGIARDDGSWERDTGRGLGSGSDHWQLLPDSEARRGYRVNGD